VHIAPLPLTSDVPNATIHWLNDDTLLALFNCYRLDTENGWNVRLGWSNLSHVCQRWRHLIHECAFHLGMHIKCTNGAPILDTLNHLPPLPLFVDYNISDYSGKTILITEQDELGIHHALRFHDRVRHINLDLPPSILLRALVLMDKHFPRLEHLSLSFTAKNSIPLTLPKAFLAPNLRCLALPSISPLRRLGVLTTTLSLVRLEFSDIQTSSYFRPKLLVARLLSLPQLEELSIVFSVPIPRPSVERELLGEQRASRAVTLPNLKQLMFKGVSAYLESFVAQIRAPLLEQLYITLFNQISFELPHLSHLINATEVFKLTTAMVYFDHYGVSVTTVHRSRGSDRGPLFLRVMCRPLDWQIDCAAQICSALIPTLSGVEEFMLESLYWEISTELQNGAIDGTTWHELLRSFIGMKELHVEKVLLEELSRALHVDEVGSDPGFLPHLRSIRAGDNLFTSFIDTRQGVGRPIKFIKWY
jgi:hypothetical protein